MASMIDYKNIRLASLYNKKEAKFIDDAKAITANVSDMIKNLVFLGFLLIFTLIANASEKVDPWDHAKKSHYSKKIEELYSRWSEPERNLNVTENSSQLDLQSIRTDGDKTYVGILAKTLVKSTINDVIKVLRDVGAYQKIYPDLDEVSFKVDPPNDYEIHWKFSGPMGTHTIYDTIQSVERLGPSKAALIYQLKKSDDVLETDGFIFLQEAVGTTKYLSVDFFNAKWGVAGTFFKDKIWETTFDNTKKATLAIKTLAEKLNRTSEPDEKVSVNYFGLDDREKQKTFEVRANEFFDTNKSDPTRNQ
jgi:hypothetical protein